MSCLVGGSVRYIVYNSIHTHTPMHMYIHCTTISNSDIFFMFSFLHFSLVRVNFLCIVSSNFINTYECSLFLLLSQCISDNCISISICSDPNQIVVHQKKIEMKTEKSDNDHTLQTLKAHGNMNIEHARKRVCVCGRSTYNISIDKKHSEWFFSFFYFFFLFFFNRKILAP